MVVYMRRRFRCVNPVIGKSDMVQMQHLGTAGLAILDRSDGQPYPVMHDLVGLYGHSSTPMRRTQDDLGVVSRIG